jgi:hypothetical protein
MTKEAAETLLFEREKLYEEIWAEPMMQVAKRYGISDVGLAKICKKMNIPRPPRGYWTKKSYGVSTRKEHLRPATVQTQTVAVVERDTKHLATINDQRRIQAPEFATERQKIRRLKIALRDMEIARRTRLYLEAMRALPNAAEPEQAQWLAWVAQYADHIDPTVDFTMAGVKAGKGSVPVYKFTAQGFVDD